MTTYIVPGEVNTVHKNQLDLVRHSIKSVSELQKDLKRNFGRGIPKNLSYIDRNALILARKQLEHMTEVLTVLESMLVNAPEEQLEDVLLLVKSEYDALETGDRFRAVSRLMFKIAHSS